MADVQALARPKAGRPTREQAELRQNELLDAALEHFLEKGFELATIEAIAQDVGMTKRTVYARYPDKTALFRAAVALAISRYRIEPADIAATDCGDLEQTLRNIAMLRIDLVASEHGLKLQRIIHTESYRFPEIFLDSYEIGAMPTIEFLASILERETRNGLLSIADPMMAANAFMSLVTTGPVRFLVSGIPLSPQETEMRVNFTVRLFLDGVRPRA